MQFKVDNILNKVHFTEIRYRRCILMTSRTRPPLDGGAVGGENNEICQPWRGLDRVWLASRWRESSGWPELAGKPSGLQGLDVQGAPPSWSRRLPGSIVWKMKRKWKEDEKKMKRKWKKKVDGPFTVFLAFLLVSNFHFLFFFSTLPTCRVNSFQPKSIAFHSIPTTLPNCTFEFDNNQPSHNNWIISISINQSINQLFHPISFNSLNNINWIIWILINISNDSIQFIQIRVNY